MTASWRQAVFMLVVSLGSGELAEAADTGFDAEPRWFLTVYAGRYAHETFAEVVTLEASYRQENSHVAVVALARELWRYEDTLALEAEGQVGKHFSDMDHWEFNGLLALRWHRFPWDEHVDTSFAFGNGLSYALGIPKIEEKYDEDAERLLIYFMFEWTFALPRQPRWNFSLRLHHRSDAFGLFEGGGSNFVCGGIRYSF